MKKIVLAIILVLSVYQSWAEDTTCEECAECTTGVMTSEVLKNCDINQDGDMLDCCCVADGDMSCDILQAGYINTCVDVTPTPTATPTVSETPTVTPTAVVPTPDMKSDEWTTYIYDDEVIRPYSAAFIVQSSQTLRSELVARGAGGSALSGEICADTFTNLGISTTDGTKSHVSAARVSAPAGCRNLCIYLKEASGSSLRGVLEIKGVNQWGRPVLDIVEFAAGTKYAVTRNAYLGEPDIWGTFYNAASGDKLIISFLRLEAIKRYYGEFHPVRLEARLQPPDT